MQMGDSSSSDSLTGGRSEGSRIVIRDGERYLMDDAGRYMEMLRAEPAVDPPAASGETAGPPPFRPKRLKRYEALYPRIAAKLLADHALVVRTNGGPLTMRIVEFPDGTAVAEYSIRSASSCCGATRLGPDDYEVDRL